MDIEQIKKKLQVIYTYIGQLERHIVDTESTLSVMKSEKSQKLAEANLLEDIVATFNYDPPDGGNQQE